MPAALAGLDQESGWPFDDAPFFGAPLKAAIASGQVPQARLDEMATRILRSMFAHGLVDDPVPASAPIDFAANEAVSQADEEQGAVLLKNDGNLLPLGPGVRSIVVIGGHADKGVLAGSGSSLVYPRGGNAVPGIAPTAWPGPVMYYPSSPGRRTAPPPAAGEDHVRRRHGSRSGGGRGARCGRRHRLRYPMVGRRLRRAQWRWMAIRTR